MKALLLLVAVNLYAISPAQVFNIAKKYTDYPSTIKAMCAVESSYGKQILGDRGKSLGILQIQVNTLRYMATKYKKLSWVKKYGDKLLATALLRNDNFSIYVASLYFNYLVKKHGYMKGIMAYNGLYVKGKLNWRYYRKVIKHLKD